MFYRFLVFVEMGLVNMRKIDVVIYIFVVCMCYLVIVCVENGFVYVLVEVNFFLECL